MLRTKLMDLQKLATTRDYQQRRAYCLKKQSADTHAAMDQQQNRKQQADLLDAMPPREGMAGHTASVERPTGRLSRRLRLTVWRP